MTNEIKQTRQREKQGKRQRNQIEFRLCLESDVPKRITAHDTFVLL